MPPRVPRWRPRAGGRPRRTAMDMQDGKATGRLEKSWECGHKQPPESGASEASMPRHYPQCHPPGDGGTELAAPDGAAGRNAYGKAASRSCASRRIAQ